VPINRLTPSFAEEELLAAQGYHLVAGVDEVGRGALVGPVVAAAVILPRGMKAGWLEQVRDSKQLTPAVREFLFDYILGSAVAIGTGTVDNRVIDSQGIVMATRLAMKMAIERLAPPPQYLVIDYLALPEVELPQKHIIDGDSLSFSIACASIVAKVIRDRFMVELDRDFPGYGLARHKGYGTREHLDCLSRLGPCPLHRRSFRPVKDFMERAQ